MTLLFIEGFDHILDTTNLLSYVGKWNTWDERSLFITGRFGDGYASTVYSSFKSLPQYETHIIIGFAFINTVAGARTLVTARNSIASTEWYISWTTDNRISFTGGTTWISSWSGSVDTWYYIEADVVSGNSPNGSFTIRINGETVLTQTGVDTSNQNGLLVASLLFGGTTVLYYDDIYILNGDDATTTQGAPNNTFYGPVRVYTIYPASGGFYSQFTPSGTSPSALNWQNVDEPNYPNDDTDFNYAPSGIFKDTFVMTSLPPEITDIKALQYNIRAKKDDVGTRRIKSLVRASGTDYTTVSGHALADSWSYYEGIWGKNPNTDALWQPSEFTTVQFGYETEE